MADGLDHLRPDTTYAHLDAYLGGPESRALTDAEVAAARLEDPTRFGLCAGCAVDGEETPAAPGCDECWTCLGESSADTEAIRARLAATAKHIPGTLAETEIRADYLRDASALLAEVETLRRWVETVQRRATAGLALSDALRSES